MKAQTQIDDGLNAARGILLGCGLGLLMWLAAIGLALRVMR